MNRFEKGEILNETITKNDDIKYRLNARKRMSEVYYSFPNDSLCSLRRFVLTKYDNILKHINNSPSHSIRIEHKDGWEITFNDPIDLEELLHQII